MNVRSQRAAAAQQWRRFTRRLRSALVGTVGQDTGLAAAMFAGIQRRMLLWYAGVLAGILLLAGLVLYLAMQQVLLRPVDAFLSETVQGVTQEAMEHGVGACDLPPFAHQGIPYSACYDPTGTVVEASAPSSGVPAFLAPSLAQRALTTGTVFDTIDGGNGLGAIRRYALAVHDPVDGHVLGVVQVGVSISDQTTALHTLLMLLLDIGALTLVGSSVGGLFLARRALAPARLAFARQQRFIGDAAHELRTPLTLLRADAEVLLRARERFPSDDAALLEDIVVETEHLASIATNLLTLARLDAGAAHLEREIVDLGNVAAGLARRVRALADEKQVALELETSGKVLVVGDRALIEQAALILLDNAIKYNRPGGTATLRVVVAGPQALLEVRDSGEGIPPEHLPQLGERFYRVDKARARAAGGAGLGLSIARSIAASHGGALTLASMPGRGTTATLAFPAAGSATRQPG
jgi:signal transduction histidine kinase